MTFGLRVILISALTVLSAPHAYAQSFSGKSISTSGAYTFVVCFDGRCQNVGTRAFNNKLYVTEDGRQAIDYNTGSKLTIGRPDDAGLVLTVSGNKMTYKTTRDEAGTQYNFTNLGDGKCRMSVSAWAKKGSASVTELGPVRCSVADGNIFAR